MEQIIHAFGLDLRLITAQAVNFILLMVVLGYFLYKPILRILNEREERIAAGIKDAEAAALARQNAETEKRAVLAAAHEEASKVGERARAHAESVQEEATTNARIKAESILTEAEVRAHEAAKRIAKESEAEIAKTAVLAAEKLLRERAS